MRETIISQTVKAYIIAMGLFLLIAPGAVAQFTVSGTVTDGAMAAVPGVKLVLYADDGTPLGIPPIQTDLSGFYSISGLPSGTYWFGFEPFPITKLLPKIIEGVNVSGNQTLNVILDPGLWLQGFVRDSLGQGISGVDLNVYDEDTGDKLITRGDDSDVLGFYQVVIPPGVYRLLWRDIFGPLMSVEYFDVTISADTTIDVTMLQGFTISGTVTDELFSPVVNADLDFIDNATGNSIVVSGDQTDAGGQYTVMLPAGTYDVRVEPLASYKLLPAVIPSVVIAANVQQDFILHPGLSLSGFVRDMFGVGVANADIDVKNASDGTKLLTPFDNTNISGFYEVIIPAGTFNLIYQPPVATMLAPIELRGAVITADTIVNVVVPNGMLLSGLVRNSSGVGIASVDIDAVDEVSGQKIPLVDDKTASDGTFETVLAPGTYQLDIEPPKATRYVAVRMNGIVLGVDTSITVTVVSGAMISGTVTDSIGLAVADVDVNAIVSASGDTVFTPADNTDLLGYYEIVIPTNTYDLIYQPDTLSGYSDTVTLSSVIIGGDTNIDVVLGPSGPVNQTPIISPIGSKSTDVEIQLLFGITASDPDGTIPELLTGPLPGGASFVDHHDGTGTFDWTPGVSQGGNYTVVFYATDGPATDSESVPISVSAGPGCCIGIRGNIDFAGGEPGIDVADLTFLVSFLFKGGPPPPCPEEGDIDGSGGPTPVDIADLTYLVNYIFKGGAAPPSCL